jgi:hypothetical protein
VKNKIFQLDHETQTELKKLVQSAHKLVQGPTQATIEEITNIYSSRDASGGTVWIQDNIPDQGIAINEMPEAVRVGKWAVPETTANLFLSRLRTITTALVPGTPTLEVKARIPQAVYAAEDQNNISEWACDHGGLEAAMRRCAFYGMISPHFAVKFVPHEDEKDVWKKATFEAVNPALCGNEPFGERFSWHTYEADWGSLPESWREAVPFESGAEPYRPWMRVQVCEVYHEGFKYGADFSKEEGCPMSIWISTQSMRTQAGNFRKNFELGNYIGTEVLPSCPLVIRSFLEPAPGEAVPPAECVSWLPLMRMIVSTLNQIDHEIRTTNNLTLYDREAIREEAMAKVSQAKRGTRLYVGVDVDNAERGVNATMRPVELNPAINLYLSALQTYIGLFDDITGAGPMERGMPQNPEKSATEAAAITQNASRRNKDRLEVMAAAWGEIARVHHTWQRRLYGKSITLPSVRGGLTYSVDVPNPKTAAVGFRVDPVDLEHISRRGEIESTLTMLNQASQTIANFRGSTPRLIRELLRRAGKALGIADVDLMLEAPILEQGPVDRYMRHLQTGEPLLVLPQDDHMLYVSYYMSIVQQHGNDEKVDMESIQEVVIALQKHQLHVQRAQEAQVQSMQQGNRQDAPGQGQTADNVAAPAMAAGAAPMLGPR